MFVGISSIFAECTLSLGVQKSILVILGIFCFSVCIRIPFLGQKLEGFGHQEWLAGHTLVILKIWQKEGLKSHYYSLPYTFYRKADKHVPFIAGVTDTRGNGYYVSYPPFAFYILYGIITVLSAIPNEEFLQIITLFVQFITGILLYILLKKSNFSDKLSVLGASVYFLLPITLRYHTQAYFCDILAQIGIVSTLILYQNYLQKKTLKNAFLTGFSLFLLTFTEWIGIFLTFTLIAHHVWTQKTLNTFLHYFIWTVCMLFAIALTLWIYSTIAGWEALTKAVIYKANQRAVSDDTKYFSRWDIHTYTTILRYYATHYYPAGLSMLIIVIIHTLKKSMITGKLPSAFMVAIIAVFLHHTIFLNFTAENDFAILKTSIPVLILWVFMVSIGRFSEYMLNMSYIILLTSALYVTYKGMIHKKENLVQYFASQLVKLSPENELLVLHSSSSISPQVMYYSERNVYMNLPQNQVKIHLQKYQLKKALVLYTDWQYNIEKIEIIEAEEK